MGYCRPMGYGVHFPAHQVGGQPGLWVKRGYGLPEVWVKRGESTVQTKYEQMVKIDVIGKKIILVILFGKCRITIMGVPKPLSSKGITFCSTSTALIVVMHV